MKFQTVMHVLMLIVAVIAIIIGFYEIFKFDGNTIGNTRGHTNILSGLVLVLCVRTDCMSDRIDKQE